MINQVYDKLVESDVFKEFTKENKDFYLTHFFLMINEGNKSPWQVGFYNKGSDMMVAFDVDLESGSIVKGQEQEVFKKEESVRKLDFAGAMDFDRALEAAEVLQKEKHPDELVSQKICILQCLPEHDTVWNITFVSMQLNVSNFKLRASDGDLKDHTFESVLRFRKE